MAGRSLPCLRVALLLRIGGISARIRSGVPTVNQSLEACVRVIGRVRALGIHFAFTNSEQSFVVTVLSLRLASK